MSFGFSIGDFIAVSELAWKLYRHCYLAAKDAPQDFKLLLQEICTLASSIKLLQDEVGDPGSTLMRSGEDRVRMLNDMLCRITITLDELEKYAKKYENLKGVPRSKRKMIWDRFKWSVEGSEIDSLRAKLARHNVNLSLILVGAGNSSLQRLESAQITLQKDFSEIKEYINLFQKPKSEVPKVLVIDDEVFRISPMSAALMKNAEVGQRRWSAIGVDEWIQAGRWWLLKSQMNLYEKSPSDQKLSQQGYADLIKAAWILVDIIGRHPQLDFLDSNIRFEVVQLTQTIQGELKNIKALGVLKPSFEDLESYDLQIWETQAKAPALQPGIKKSKGLAQANYQSWDTAEEDVLFQRFGHYQYNPFTTQAPCIVLFLLHKKERSAKIVIRDQSWTTFATFIVGKMSTYPAGNFVQIEQQKIQLSTPEDAEHLCAISQAAEEYLFHCKRDGDKHEILQALALLFAVKNNYRRLVKRLFQDEAGLNSESSSFGQEDSLATRTHLAAKLLASEFLDKGSPETYASEVARGYASLLRWTVLDGYNEVAKILLEWKEARVSDEDLHNCSSLHAAARNGKMAIVKLLLSENGVYPDAVDDKGWMAFELALWNGQEMITEKFLKMGAMKVNKTHDGLTPLMVAARAGYETVIELLLKLGADVNSVVPGGHGMTALKAAVRGGHESVVDRLLEAGADAGIDRNPVFYASSSTALQEAAEGGNEALVNKLLNAGANVNSPGTGYRSFEALGFAAENGHTAIVERFLKEGADVNNPGALMPLPIAAERGHRAVVDKLLEAGADVNAPVTTGGYTALQAAAEKGYEHLVDTLLRAGADVNASASRGGYTALQAAAKGGYETLVNKLLEAGADVNAPAAERGLIALEAAARGGHEAIVEILLEAGANVNAPPSYKDYGRTALEAAAERGHKSVIDKLLKAGADVNAPRTHYGLTPLRAAAGRGNEAIVQMLLEAGVDIHIKPPKGQATVLEAAAKGGNEAVVDRLLKAGVNVNIPDEYPVIHNALRVAAGRGSLAIVQKLLKAGANVNDPSEGKSERTALQAAARGGHLAVVVKLLEVGADVNAPGLFTCEEPSPLEAAIVGGHEAVFDKLLEAGADINLRRSSQSHVSFMPLNRAIGASHTSIIEKLLALGARDNGLGLGLAASLGHKPIVEMLLKVPPEINASEQRYEGLVGAAIRGNEDIVEILLKAGADPNICAGRQYHTPLRRAAESGSETIVEMLIKAGADIDEARDECTPTALALAAKKGHTAVVSRLLKAGADPNASAWHQNKYHTSLPLWVAAEGGHKTIVEMLIKAGVNISDKSRKLAIQAPSEGHEAVAKRLMEAVAFG